MSVQLDSRSFEVREHWISLGDALLAVSEYFPKKIADESTHQTLFFLHGRFGNAEIWPPLAWRLATQFRCVQVDLPGFGRSSLPARPRFSLIEHSHVICELVGRFTSPSRKAVLVGHDVGGAIAQLCAVHRPQALAALVLINAAAPTPRSTLKSKFFGWRSHRMLRLLKRQMKSLAWTHHSLKQALEAWQSAWPGETEWEACQKKLSHSPHPVLLLWGKQDPVNSLEVAEALMRRFPDAYLFEHEGCGHWPSLEAHEWADTKIREFLFRLQADGSVGS